MLETTASQHSKQTTRSPKYGHHHIAITVTCPICDAGYTPAAEHQNLLQSPPVALESAFMRMCHFCFRCRRPACPACWDNIHGVCGACVQEAGLPFRAQATPLKGVVFPPIHQEQSAQEDISSPQLICIRPGYFQDAVTPETAPLKEERSNGEQSSSIVVAETSPALPEASLSSSPTDTSAVDASPVPETTSALPSSGSPEVEKHDEDKHIKPFVRFMKVVERIVTVILLLVLLAIVGLIILAEVSVSANAQIVRFLHVDIRDEVAYLLYLVRQIHW